MIFNVHKCSICGDKFATLPSWLRVRNVIPPKYEKQEEFETVTLHDGPLHYTCRLKSEKLKKLPQVNTYSGALILLVGMYESLLSYRDFLLQWVVFTTFVYLFWHFAWIGFVLCYVFYRQMFWSYAVICVFSWSGYYFNYGDGPLWLSYPHMQFWEVAWDVFYTLIRAFFLKRALDVINTYMCESKEEVRAKQIKLLMVVGARNLRMVNIAFLSFLGVYGMNVIVYMVYGRLMVPFDVVAVCITLTSWAPIVFLDKKEVWIPIDISVPNIDFRGWRDYFKKEKVGI